MSKIVVRTTANDKTTEVVDIRKKANKGLTISFI